LSALVAVRRAGWRLVASGVRAGRRVPRVHSIDNPHPTQEPTMTSPRSLQASLSQQAIAFGLAAMVTAGVLSGLLGLAGADQSALLAQRLQAAPQAASQAAVQAVAAPQA